VDLIWGMLILISLQVTAWGVYTKVNEHDIANRKAIVDWLMLHKLWEIRTGLTPQTLLNVEALEKERYAAISESIKLSYRIDRMEAEKQEFYSFYHKQIGIRDNEIEFLKRYIKEIKPDDI
jgi:hypothetical protein